MNLKRFIPIIIVVGVFGTSLVGISAMGQTEPKGGMNLLKEEMVALERAFEGIIDAVIFGNMKLIKPAIPPLNKAREKVGQAIKAGEKIILPKNQEKFKEFLKLDDKFHREFEALEKAAEGGKKKMVKDQTHKLFDACVVCHESFRK
ncbi:MAG: cytochrome c [Thermodesulfobacteriota bacterium]|jgi:hypothetical protein